MSLKASIIIPVRNKLNFTEKCLESIAKSPPQLDYEIIVVDNASDDGTREFLEEEQRRGELLVIRNDPPRHFAVSCNQGAKIASGEYLVFLNNDTEAFPGWLEAMVAVAERSSQIGAVGAKLLYPDGTIQHAGVAFHYFKKLKRCGPYHIFRQFPRHVNAVCKEREFQCVTGACMLTPRGVFDELGGFDERFINCFEDVDYCLRLQERGYKVIYTPKAELIHYEGQTPGRSDNVAHSGEILRKKLESSFKADESDYLGQEGFFIHEDEDGTLTVYPGREIIQWRRMINQLAELKQYRMVVDEMEKLEQVIGADHRELLELRGKCSIGLGDLRAARRAYSRAQSLEPDRPEPRWGLVQVALAEGKTREARLQRLIAEYSEDERRVEWQCALDEIEHKSDSRAIVIESGESNAADLIPEPVL